MAKVKNILRFLAVYVALMMISGCLYFIWYSAGNHRATYGAIERGRASIISANLTRKPCHSDLWYNISNETILWHLAHYEHRHFVYGAPAAILMLFHYHLSPFPSLYASVTVTIGDIQLTSKCIQAHVIPFGKVVKVKKEVDFLFYAVFKNTDLKGDSLECPDYIQLYENDPTCTSVPIVEKIHVYCDHVNDTKIKFATCLYKGIAQTKDVVPFDIVSWIEINRAIGVQHITIYNQDMSAKMLQLLKKYEEENYVKLVDWKLHNPDKRIANNGQVATTQDCFYRYLRRAKYILFIDMDELIIPHLHANLSDMMESINHRRRKVTQYRFFNSFWHLTDKPALGTYVPSPNEPVPIHFERANRTKNCPETKRYKNIIKVEGAIRIGIHHMYKMKDGEIMYQVPEEIGLMHHYRRPDYAKNEEQIQDMVMSKYAHKVMSRLKQ